MGRRLRYHVAASLDGFIAGPKGEYDWIVQDPAVDFRALFRQFDAAVMGRKTYDAMRANGGDGSVSGLDVTVFSRTLPPASRKAFRIVNDDPVAVASDLKGRAGGDIWLFGGGALFRTLSEAGLVDTVEIAVVPVILGSGVPLAPVTQRIELVLGDHKVLPKSGMVVLSYAVSGTGATPPPIAYVKAS